MRKELFKRLSILGVLLCIPLAMMAQGIKVTGRVMDGVMNTGFPGATVTVKDTAIGQVTDMDGNYTIMVPSRESVLVFSFLGYADQELVVGDRTVIDVVLQEDNQAVDEVVVIAYGTQNKGLVTSAISSVGTKDLVKSPAASVTNMLAGAMPGVSAVQTSGQPGADAAAIRVRGAGTLTSSLSQPLILVDGIERDFSQLDPNEIESISVLKDASSTAVFGVRGANGVILVTTRRGTLGAPTINVTASLGVQQPISLVEQVGSYEYAKFWNARADLDIDQYGGSNLSKKFTPEQIEAYRTGSDPIMYPNKDWAKEIFNDVFVQSKNNINISGGSENVKYFVSMGYLYQNGIIKQLPFVDYDNNYRYNRYNYRANLDVKLSPTTQMKFGVGGYVGKTQAPRTTGSTSNTVDTGEEWSLIQAWTVPFAGPGVVNGIRTQTTSGHIPYSEVPRDGYFVFVGGYTQRFNTTLNLDVDITQDLKALTKGLTVSVKGAYNNNFSMLKTRAGGGWMTQNAYYKSHFPNGDTTKQADYAMPETDPDFDKTHVFQPTGESVKKGSLTYDESTGQGQSWYIEGRLNYDRTFGDHRVTGLFLYNQSRAYYPATQKDRYGHIPHGYIGYVFRATYAYKNKYLADINMGYNGSENFAPGKTRYGLFPSASIGWVVSEEGFMEKQKVFSYLKIRASLGRVGNDNSASRFLYAPSAWVSSGSYSFGAESPAVSSGMAMSTEGNPGVTWEVSDKQNYGIDAKFLDNRLSLTADYFREHRTGILIKPNSFPGITAIDWPQMNIGIINNRGYEVSLGWSDTPGKDISYYVNANVSYARNKIVYIDEVPNTYSYMDYTGLPSGVRELFNTWGINGPIYKFERLYQESDFIPGTYTLREGLPVPNFAVRPGDAMYADLNGDGVVNDDDKFVTGYGLYPEYTFGLNAGFTWKGLSFSMQWVGATHVDRYMYDTFRYPFTEGNSRGLFTYFYEDCWTFENQENATLPRPTLGGRSWNYANSTLWMKDATYVRLKNVTIGYTFTNPSLKKAGISSLGITLSGYNLLTFTPLKNLDPEITPTNSSGYPLVKLYSLGVNINF